MSEEQRQHIISQVRKLIYGPDLTINDVKDPSLDPRDVIVQVKSVSDENYYHIKKETQYFISFLFGKDFLMLSTYFYFDKSDSQGFQVLPHKYKIKFVNDMKIPLLTLGLSYMWIPSLELIESIEMKKLIWFDGFSKDSFFDALNRVMNGYEIVTSKYEEFREFINKETGQQ